MSGYALSEIQGLPSDYRAKHSGQVNPDILALTITSVVPALKRPPLPGQSWAGSTQDWIWVEAGRTSPALALPQLTLRSPELCSGRCITHTADLSPGWHPQPLLLFAPGKRQGVVPETLDPGQDKEVVCEMKTESSPAGLKLS